MKGSFTRGPWEVEQSTRDGATIRTSGPEPVWYVADIAGCLPGGPEETQANARLIAAAPALLEALQGARQTILDLKNSRWSEAEGPDEDWVGDIDAAIQSATGEG